MKITMLPDAERRPRRIAVGEFDGVHLGHREVIRGNDTVLTFHPHPQAVVNPASAPKLLYPQKIKADLIAGLGVEELVTSPFDREFSRIAPEEFIGRVILATLEAKHVSVGENFRFGARAQGTPELLASRREFETRVVPREGLRPQGSGQRKALSAPHPCPRSGSESRRPSRR